VEIKIKKINDVDENHIVMLKTISLSYIIILILF